MEAPQSEDTVDLEQLVPKSNKQEESDRVFFITKKSSDPEAAPSLYCLLRKGYCIRLRSSDDRVRHGFIRELSAQSLSEYNKTKTKNTSVDEYVYDKQPRELGPDTRIHVPALFWGSIPQTTWGGTTEWGFACRRKSCSCCTGKKEEDVYITPESVCDDPKLIHIGDKAFERYNGGQASNSIYKVHLGNRIIRVLTNREARSTIPSEWENSSIKWQKALSLIDRKADQLPPLGPDGESVQHDELLVEVMRKNEAKWLGASTEILSAEPTGPDPQGVKSVHRPQWTTEKKQPLQQPKEQQSVSIAEFPQ